MTSPEGAAADAEILKKIRELAAGLSDERSRRVVQNMTGALELNPQPIPPGVLRSVLEAVALNPQPLPPSGDAGDATGAP